MLRPQFKLNRQLNRFLKNQQCSQFLSTTSTIQSKCAFYRVDNLKKPKITNPLDAVSSIKTGSHIFVQMGANTSEILLKALATHIKENNLKNVRIEQLLTLGVEKDLWRELHENGSIKGNSFFASGDNRKLINDGLADYTPVFLSDTSKIFANNSVQLDAVITQVSPADKYGYHSLGATLISINEAIENCKTLICQVNKNIPRTFGDSTIHQSKIDIIVEQDTLVPQLANKDISEEDRKIGKLIAENFIQDSSTLQLGIGTIPDSVLTFCKDFKDLGIHSEMVSDNVVDLYEAGAITNNSKVIEKGRTLVTFALGTNKLYNYLNDNPAFAFKNASYVNDESIICQNPNIVAINSCIEIDLSGQAASGSIGRNVFSGFGGQVDFLRGASKSKNGKPILAFNSTTKGKSKIVIDLKPHSEITSSRAHVDYVVTEYGIANLFGKTLRQRAYELIQIAHPDHRELLERGAFELLKCMPCKDY